jgi:molecular chaperone GrpE
MTNPNESSVENPALDPAMSGSAEAPAAATATPEAAPAVDPAAEAVAAAQRLAAETQDKYLRLAAEFDNFRKRSIKERQEAELKGMGLLIRGILDALDDLGRFAHVDPATVDAAMVVSGADMVEKKLLKSLAGHGLEVVNPVEQPFDPALHEAITTMPAESAEMDDVIAQVFQVGYRFNGQLLRPARVVVRKWNG